MSIWGSLLGALGAIGGSIIAPGVGTAIGGQLGSLAGNIIDKPKTTGNSGFDSTVGGQLGSLAGNSDSANSSGDLTSQLLGSAITAAGNIGSQLIAQSHAEREAERQRQQQQQQLQLQSAYNELNNRHRQPSGNSFFPVPQNYNNFAPYMGNYMLGGDRYNYNSQPIVGTSGLWNNMMRGRY